jgi:hypothetical protein
MSSVSEKIAKAVPLISGMQTFYSTSNGERQYDRNVIIMEVMRSCDHPSPEALLER